MAFVLDPPKWVTEFLEKKAPWWLEEGSSPLEIVAIYDDMKIAQVRRCGFVYTLVSETFSIR